VGSRLASNAESKALAVAGLNNQRTVNVNCSDNPITANRGGRMNRTGAGAPGKRFAP
jgi:hypothetical protein